MASSNEAKNTHLTEADIKVLLSWIERPANFESIYGTSGKTTVGGKAKITKSAAYTQMAAHLRSKTKKYESLKPRNMQQRWENVVKKFREVLKLQGGTGMGLTAAEIRQGVSLPTKLEKMCPCFYRLEALFGERPNMNAHATVELGAVVCTTVTESVPTETKAYARNAEAKIEFLGAKLEEEKRQWNEKQAVLRQQNLDELQEKRSARKQALLIELIRQNKSAEDIEVFMKMVE
ncbi:uncharacterized protein IUM83_01848 [Phytophthora cinnamomi]|uniref:uncharacterized protein n=1 Tax=Phytophthora cinnamomi TaxID=4785 RepID=UPI003559783A|nr:hypothetical protein IUM83_01848 [Phytophthora cinnamomi]